jgi:hypothetical protein
MEPSRTSRGLLLHIANHREGCHAQPDVGAEAGAGGERKLRNESPVQALTLRRSWREATMKSFLIGALVVAVVVLGYLYWDREHNTIFKAPGVEIKKN